LALAKNSQKSQTGVCGKLFLTSGAIVNVDNFKQTLEVFAKVQTWQFEWEKESQIG
jgi:hypothetical protein